MKKGLIEHGRPSHGSGGSRNVSGGDSTDIRQPPDMPAAPPGTCDHVLLRGPRKGSTCDRPIPVRMPKTPGPPCLCLCRVHAIRGAAEVSRATLAIFDDLPGLPKERVAVGVATDPSVDARAAYVRLAALRDAGGGWREACRDGAPAWEALCLRPDVGLAVRPEHVAAMDRRGLTFRQRADLLLGPTTCQRCASAAAAAASECPSGGAGSQRPQRRQRRVRRQRRPADIIWPFPVRLCIDCMRAVTCDQFKMREVYGVEEARVASRIEHGRVDLWLSCRPEGFAHPTTLVVYLRIYLVRDLLGLLEKDAAAEAAAASPSPGHPEEAAGDHHDDGDQAGAEEHVEPGDPGGDGQG